MKKSIDTLTQSGLRFAGSLFLTLLLLLGLSLQPAHAQNQQPLKIYFLTNTLATNGFNLINGSLAIPPGSSNILSQPFPVWRGRGFTFNAGFYLLSQGGAGSNAGFSIRWGSIHSTNGSSGTGLVTNWSGFNPLTLICTNAGTNEVYYWTNISPSSIDNVSLGQFQVATNGSTNTLLLDPTNTFIGVYP